MIGQVVIGKYRITRPLDQGGMSKIYLARQLDQNRDVVVKVLQEQHLSVPKTREHFRREIYIMSRFRHPNAVTYYDSSLTEPRGPVLVMEYLRGVDLYGLLHRDGRMAPDRVGRLLAQLCDVLQAAHDAGIVHRDVKPGNVMILNAGTPQETVKLMDFGLAKMSNALYISPDELVDFNLPPAAGTPEYISPEQVRGNEMDARADLYSVGIILYEMLAGRRPFGKPISVDDLLLAHAHAKPPTFADIGVTDVPAAIEEVVRRCLEKFPEQRYRSAMELAQRYEQALGRRINVVRRSAPNPADAPNWPAGPTAGTGRLATTAQRPGPSTPAPRSVAGMRHSVEAVMPEAMAMVKLKGFIYDLGGEVVESEPGLIRVRLPEKNAPKNAGGLFGWSKPTAAPPAAEVELHMERRDPAQPNKLTITLVVRPNSTLVSTEWHARCKRLGMDLQAYLMGR
jgi:serine/threonine-protein kinase